ncbi:hypothetical protein HK097_007469 [Rhizophlyctis rosea]|uniref:Uncharacterized protein n=1 Tax=Rhizophlyctis rosea TaxID=64517 RepID=A0AAD5SEM0_9FUNG|nr:hypothetical protein HK097_007469 [Rhizophlyctis rosea]
MAILTHLADPNPLPVHIPLSPTLKPVTTSSCSPISTTPSTCPSSPRKRKDQRRTRRMTLIAETTAEVSALSTLSPVTTNSGRRRRSLGRDIVQSSTGAVVADAGSDGVMETGMEELVLPASVVNVDDDWYEGGKDVRGRRGRENPFLVLLNMGEEEQLDVLRRG